MTLSIICPTNDKSKCERWLLPSLARQDFRDFEVVLVDTNESRVGSAAEALNVGAAKAKGDYLVFVHHDVELLDSRELRRLVESLKGRDFLVAGAAGTCSVSGKPWRKHTITNLVHGEQREHPGNSTRISDATPCETLDECLFVVPRSVWMARPFPVFYPSWHLYAVEYALWANVRRKGSVLAVPLNLWHHSSGGSFNKSYYGALRVLSRMYRKDYSVLHTPIAAWPTQAVLLEARILLDWLLRKARG